MSISPGTRFGGYEVVEPIGAGGMGEVWRARDTELKREVAVKVLPRAFADDADRLARFRREAELLASLNHANIAQVYGLEQLDGQTVIVMELVEGPTLADRIKDGPIPPDEAMSIALQVVSALEAAHANQIVHRDLKPANIKLKDDGTVKVLDFGISKSIDPQAISGAAPVMTTPAMTQTGVILGTAAYMSPEQARGKFVDQRTDIWAFGCLLFEMLTGQPAFGGEDVMLTLARVLDRATDLSSIPKTISPAVRHTIKLCLEKDPRKRIADIRDVRLALEGTFETEMPRGTEPVRRVPFWRRAIVPVFAVTAVGVAVGVAVWFVMRPEPPHITRFVDVLPNGVEFGISGDLAVGVSPAGDQIAYAGNDAIYVRAIDDIEPRRLDQTAGEQAVHPVFSPDGEELLYWSISQRQLKRISAAGGSPVVVTNAGNPYGPAWLADNSIIYGGDDGRIRRVPASGGQEPEILFEQSGTLVAPELLPDGETVLFQLNNQIFAGSIATGDAEPLFAGNQVQYLDSGHVVYADAPNGNLLARAFDAETLEFGGPVALIDDLYVSPNAAAQWAVSRNGTLIYVEGQNGLGQALGTVLAIVDEDGAIEALPVPTRGYSAPRVSPDGARIAVQVNADETHSNIFIYDLSGRTEMRQLTFDGNLNEQPYWKDEQTLLFASDRDGTMSIYEQRIDGGTATRLTPPGEVSPQLYPAWTPDGRLAYSARASGGLDTFLVSPGSDPEVLISEAGDDGDVSFSPDGSAMAYLATSTSGIQGFGVYVQRYPPDSAKRLVSREGVLTVFPRWVRNGTESPLTLAYQEAIEGNIGAVDITLPGLEFGNRRTLFRFAGVPNQSQFDAIPGTDRFVVNWSSALGANAQRASVLPQRVIVVENWISEIESRVRPD